MRKKINLLIVLGTRPEALKLAPVYLAAKKDRAFNVRLCVTAQHREMTDQVLDFFGISPDFDLDIMQQGQTLGDLTHRLFSRMDVLLKKQKPDLIMIQGDTTTAFAVALKSFYEKIPAAHVEAGLRTHDKYRPFPEEINRTLISRVTDYHFAPTPESRRNLLAEGVPADKIWVTGNTVVDALERTKKILKRRFLEQEPARLDPSKKWILVTAHRRESFGAPLRAICHALKTIASRFPETEIIYPVHPNPQVQKTVQSELGRIPSIKLLKPLPYQSFMRVMQGCHFILTDSGGIQEEAPSFGKPVLVMREVSERPDGIRMGIAKLVGMSEQRIVAEASRLLRNRSAYSRMVKNRNPYGDGRAARRILGILKRECRKGRR